jgi:hypothetical protein
MKTTRALLFVVIVSVLGVPCFAAEELSPEKRLDIERLLELTGAASLGLQMATAVATQMSQVIKKARPDIPQKVLDVLPEEIVAVFDSNIGSFKDTIIPVYHKHFTGEEIKEMIRFYSTDLGKKTIRVMPALLNESMVAGQKWGQSLVPEINQRVRARLKKEGIEL